MIAGLVLAAGGSTRMGSAKVLLPLPWGTTVLGSVVTSLLASDLDKVIVVLGYRAADMMALAELSADHRLHIIVNPDWSQGLSSSLRHGLYEIGDADAALIALGDQPGISRERVRLLMNAWHHGRAPLVVPVHENRMGHPVLFARELFSELMTLSGDIGGREVVQRHLRHASLVEMDPLWDLDTESDYQAFLKNEKVSSSEGLLTPSQEDHFES